MMEPTTDTHRPTPRGNERRGADGVRARYAVDAAGRLPVPRSGHRAENIGRVDRGTGTGAGKQVRRRALGERTRA